MFEDFNILCLNTALTSLDENDMGNLIIGMNCVMDILDAIKDNNNNPIIVLAHHSVYIWKDSERRFFQNLLEEGRHKICLLLCGHEHYMGYSNVAGIAEFVVGTLALDKGSAYGFYIGELDNKQGQGSIEAYIGDTQNCNWGEYSTFNIHQHSKKNRRTFNYSSDSAYLAVKVFQRKKKGDKILQGKYRLIDLTIKNHRDSYSIESLSGYILTGCDSHIFLLAYDGRGGVGKTTTLKFIWKKYCEEPHKYPITIYIPLKDCSNNIFNYIDREYGIEKDFLLSNSIKRVERLIILLDGLNEVSMENQEEIINHVEELTRGNNICILTSRKDYLANYRVDLSAKFKRFKILPLTKKQRADYFRDKTNMPTKKILNILDTPLLIKLYEITQEAIYNYENDTLKKFNFRGLGGNNNEECTSQCLTTEGEIFWNYYQLQHLKIKEQSRWQDLKELAIDFILPALGYYLSYNCLNTVKLNEMKNSLMQYHNIEKYMVNMKKKYPSDFIDLNDVWNRIILDILINEFGFLQNSDPLNRRNPNISFEHESLKDFFAAVYLYNREKIAMEDIVEDSTEVIAELSKPKKNPTKAVQAYLIEIIDVEYINKIIVDSSLSDYARAVAYILLGDIYYFKYKYNFITILTKELDEIACLEKAKKHYEKAANLNVALGYWNLGFVCRILYEKVTESNLKNRYEEEAFKNTKKSSDMGYSYAYNHMGVLYLKGIGTNKDMKKARYYFEKGVEMGVAHSYNHLGKLEEEQALHWAARGNFKKAYECYTRAFEIFFEQAINIGEEYGINRLTYYYFDGLEELGKFDVSRLDCNERYGTLKNEPEIYMSRLLNRAAIAGNRYAIERKNRCDKLDL